MITLQPSQCFAIVISIFGFIGFLQGWRRAIVVMGFALAALFFLYVGGANGIAQFLFVSLPQAINVLTGGLVFSKSLPPPTPTEVLISAILTIGVALILGFIIGNRAFPATPSTSDRFLGIIPGLVTGLALVVYFSHVFAGSRSISVGVTPPSPSTIGNYIVALVVISIVAIILGLVTARFGGK
jgi:hypothetical protein